MTSISDREWSRLADTWREVADHGAERWIRALVVRQTRFLRVTVAFEIMVTIVLLSPVVLAVARNPTSEMIGWGIAAFAHSALVWGFTLRNRAGIWRPLGESTREYLALARERARRHRLAARFVIALVAVESAALAVWLAVRDQPVTVRSLLLPGLVLVGAFGWGIWGLMTGASRIAELDRLSAELGLEPAPGERDPPDER